MLVCVLTMTTGFAIVLVQDIAKIKRTMADQAAMVARVIGESCVSAITFEYPDNAEKSLSLIGGLEGFENARVYKTNGELFASYDKVERIEGPHGEGLRTSREYRGRDLHLIEPIRYQGNTYGMIYLRVRPSFEEAIRARIVNMGGVLFGLLALCYLLASLVQRIISRPILQLADTAEKVSDEMDYSLRLENTNSGEIGILFEAFNEMLGAVQQREIERSRAEGDLRFKEQVIESTTSCIATADLSGRITYTNPSFRKLFGIIEQEEVFHGSLARFFADNDVFDRMLVMLAHQGTWSHETGAKKMNGDCFDAIISADTIRNSDENHASLVITVSDISELRIASREMERENWLKSGQSAIYERLRGEQDVRELARNLLRGLKEHIEFQVGAIYVANDHRQLSLSGGYALDRECRIGEKCLFGEGLAGQAALDRQKILVSHLPEDYLLISSGVGTAVPRHLLAMPFIFENQVKGVLELGSFNEFQSRELELLERVTVAIAIAVHTAQSREQVRHLLEKTQAQSEELQAQTEELRTQQEELQQINLELEEQRDNIKKKNEELELARSLVEKKVADLEITGRYKSEFLANMSHELRTPLNSITLLSDVLMENRDGTLSAKHLEYVANVNAAGADLRALINDILDLSKVESGRMDVVVEEVVITDLLATMERIFSPVSQQKDLPLLVTAAENAPRIIRSDRQRIEQVLKNLLSNAFKFTEKGRIEVLVETPGAWSAECHPGLAPDNAVVFSVRDTGIGIAEAKQALIFEAFMQADGTTSRRYGGTGLGLSISREIAGLLGGELLVRSTPGQGSTFSLILPRNRSVWEKDPPPPALPTEAVENQEILHCLHDHSAFNGKHILLVDDDMRNVFAISSILEDKGLTTTICKNGREALEALDRHPTKALVLMDMMMPEMDGYQALGEIRKQKRFEKLPVIAVTANAMARDRFKCIEAGASDYLAKPIDRDKLLSMMRVWLY